MEHIRPDFAGYVRAWARPVVQRMREVPVRSDMILRRGRGPVAVFLPARGQEGASLVRIHNVAQALRHRGWRTLVLPWRLTLAQRRRFLAASAPDVLVMQGVRHELNRPSLYPGIPIVMDLDDADFHLPHLSEPLRSAMPDVSAVVAGSDYVAEWCRAAGAPQVHVIWTGMPVSSAARPPQDKRPPVVAWAQTRPMTYRREAELVRSVMAKLSQSVPATTLRLFDYRPGDDRGFAQWFRAAGIQTEWYDRAQFRDYLKMFDDVALGLAPLCPETPFSRGKSFGKILAYLDRHVPVICSAAGEHGAFFDAETGVLAHETDDWVGAAERLLADPHLRQSLAHAGFRAFEKRLSLDAVASRMHKVLLSHVEKLS